VTAPRRAVLALSLLLAAAISAVSCAAVQTGSEFEPVHIGPFAAIDSVNYDRAPVPITMEPPAYPEFAKDAGIVGTVMLRILVGDDGHVENVQVMNAADVGLANAADGEARRWVFSPALRDGQPVSAALKVPITFRLEGRP
jgi:protein TonB